MPCTASSNLFTSLLQNQRQCRWQISPEEVHYDVSVTSLSWMLGIAKCAVISCIPVKVASLQRRNALWKAAHSGGIGLGQLPIGQRADQEDAIPVGEPVVGQLRQAGLTAAL